MDFSIVVEELRPAVGICGTINFGFDASWALAASVTEVNRLSRYFHSLLNRDPIARVPLWRFRSDLDNIARLAALVGVPGELVAEPAVAVQDRFGEQGKHRNRQQKRNHNREY